MDERQLGILSLQERRLLPPEWRGSVESVGLTGALNENLRSRFRGALLGTAIGDALGRPAEAKDAALYRARWGLLTDFVPWRGWQSGPTGTVTDDTQLTMCVTETLIARNGIIDPKDLAQRLVRWLPTARGKGEATSSAVSNLSAGIPWYEAGVYSAGNGAAMRAAPVGLAHLSDVDALRRDAALSAVVTHAHPMAVAGTVAQAFATAWCVHRKPGTLDTSSFLDSLGSVLSELHEPGVPERRHGASGDPVRLATRIAELGSMLELDPETALDRLWSGALVLESLPAALWCFLKSPEDAEGVVVRAVNYTRDSDTVAAMAGALVGAYLGQEAFPERWLNDLEYARELRHLADRLLDTVRGAPDGSSTTAPEDAGSVA